MKRLVDVYPYAFTAKGLRFLIFKRAPQSRYAGQWRMIGGKARAGETYSGAALRELKEETALSPELFWNIPSLNQFYEADTDQIHHIPAFAAELNDDIDEEIRLNHEHTKYKWIETGKIKNFVAWPEQRRLMQLAANLITEDQILDDWIIEKR
jgi:dihydroneopterin triphosphate diphosphatase